jgi:hypothetical protein
MKDPVLQRGLSRNYAAYYIGVSPSKFDNLVSEGRMPKPRMIDSKPVYDILELDSAFEEFPIKCEIRVNSWD